MTWYKKELQIKMSFLLNVSNGSSRPEEFGLKDIEVFVDSEKQNWFKWAHVGKILGIGGDRGYWDIIEWLRKVGNAH